MTETGLLIQRVIYAGLEALGTALSADLSVCLYVDGAAGPQLYQRRPSLTAMAPGEAFSLFGALRDLLEAGGASDAVTISGFTGTAHLDEGEWSRVLWVVGRVEGEFDASEARVVADLASAVGVVIRALGDVRQRESVTDSIEVTVEATEGLVRAEVWVPIEGTMRASRAEALSPTTAVAQAALAAIDPGMKLATAAEDTIDGERAVLVLVRDSLGRSALGCALCGADPLHATALAAVQAARAL